MQNPWPYIERAGEVILHHAQCFMTTLTVITIIGAIIVLLFVGSDEK